MYCRVAALRRLRATGQESNGEKNQTNKKTNKQTNQPEVLPQQVGRWEQTPWSCLYMYTCMSWCVCALERTYVHLHTLFLLSLRIFKSSDVKCIGINCSRSYMTLSCQTVSRSFLFDFYVAYQSVILGVTFPHAKCQDYRFTEQNQNLNQHNLLCGLAKVTGV